MPAKSFYLKTFNINLENLKLLASKCFWKTKLFTTNYY